MTSNRIAISLAAALTFEVSEISAQTLAQRSFDVIFEGDDPGEVFTFDLAFDPAVPSTIRFMGSFENLATDETGVRYEYWWRRADGTGDDERFGIDFTPLPASGQLPVQFDQRIEFTPDIVFFHVEGGGPSDHFRFVGAFTVQEVPEPGVLPLLCAAAVVGLRGRRRMRTESIPHRD